MCGIYGMVSLTNAPLRWPHRLPAMGEKLRRRGPDQSATWVSPHAVFGVERLRIVDPRPVADQPFKYRDLILACNGEVYNAAELRAGFPEFPFRSRSDVEVLLPLIASRGPDALATVEGMFAIAAWDASNRRLILARDRAGEKPLFTLEMKGELWFASEMAALLCHPEYVRHMDRSALQDYLALGFFPEPSTPFCGLQKVPAARVVIATREGVSHRPYLRTASAPNGSCPGSLEPLMRRAVARQTVADVPVGVFLSGGVDSGLLTGLASQILEEPLHSYTARFADARYDESRYASRLAALFGTTHHTIDVDTEGLLEAAGILTAGLSEPLADPALLPTWLLARKASQTAGVVLVGEGADELFGGYPTYLGHGWLRRPLLPGVGSALRRITSRAAGSDTRVPMAWLVNRFAAHAHEPGAARHLAWTGWGMAGYLPDLDRKRLAQRLAPDAGGPWNAASAMEVDYRLGLRDSLLVKIDRATMWFGLEARAPFLDPQVTDWARALSPHRKVSGLHTKMALKALAQRYLPRDVVRRRKQGLSVPIAALLNGPLRGEVDRQFAGSGRDRIADLLPAAPVEQIWTEHRAGRANHARAIWTVFTLLTWLDHWGVG